MDDPQIDDIAQPLAAPTAYEDEALTPVQPAYATILRIIAVITSIVLLAAVLGLELLSNAAFDFIPAGVILVPTLLLIAFLTIRMPTRRYRGWGYAMGEDRLRVVSGVMFRSDTIVPFGRVQHIDVDQGPLERKYGLATLTLYTAGTHNASVSLPGLPHDIAIAMREDIRAHIKRETL